MFILIDFHNNDICSEAKNKKKKNQMSFLSVVNLCIYMNTMLSRLHKIGVLSY